MDNIIEPTIEYDFSKLYLGPPSTLTGGAYFTRIMYNTNKQLFIQTPKCLTKQGFIKSGKKIYADLMFDNNDTVFIHWIENLESRCQELIFEKGQNWFETKLEKDDIETAFTSPFKIFKSGKYYLLRVNVKQNIKVYDENNQPVNNEDISSDKMIISILEIQGIKFTSRNFQIEIELKQSMVVSPDPFLDTCFIKKPNKHQDTYSYKEEPEKEPEKVVSLGEIKKDDININLDEFIDSVTTDLTKQTEEPLEVNIDVPDINENIVLEMEELNPKKNPDALEEVDLSSHLENSLETISLKKPNQVYYEIYKKAREKAKEAKKTAVIAYLEMKNIKKTYMLDEIDESDSEFEDFVSYSDTESLGDDTS